MGEFEGIDPKEKKNKNRTIAGIKKIIILFKNNPLSRKCYLVLSDVHLSFTDI